jgi:hypothetical protein
MSPLTLLSVCEDMFQLNILNRTKRNLYPRYLTFQLKNSLVKHLYETGHCTEALLRVQKFECWSCFGTWEHHSGEICFKCGGTGVFREVWHYAFRFEVNGRRFSWHQPKTMVDFPVKLSPGLPEVYTDPELPAKENIELFQRHASLAIWNIAIYLFLHGAYPKCVKFSELPYVTSLLWEIRKRYYGWIYWPFTRACQSLRTRLFNDPTDDIPF